MTRPVGIRILIKRRFAEPTRLDFGVELVGKSKDHASKCPKSTARQMPGRAEDLGGSRLVTTSDRRCIDNIPRRRIKPLTRPSGVGQFQCRPRARTRQRSGTTALLRPLPFPGRHAEKLHDDARNHRHAARILLQEPRQDSLSVVNALLHRRVGHILVTTRTPRCRTEQTREHAA